MASRSSLQEIVEGPPRGSIVLQGVVVKAIYKLRKQLRHSGITFVAEVIPSCSAPEDAIQS